MAEKKDTLESRYSTQLVSGKQAKQEEQAKSTNQRAEDVAYTINHAIICTLSDFIDPVIGNYTQKLLNTRLTLGHDHHHGDGHGHNIWDWVKGELFGDLVAVPITIGAQRMFPGQMRWVNTAMEHAFGTFFKDGARDAAVDWAMRNNIATGDERVMEKAKEYYDNEVGHLAQTAVWTAAAYAGNVLSQKHLFGNKGSYKDLIIAKGVGSMVTAGLVMGTRSNFPEASEKYDKAMSDFAIKPATNFVNNLLGVDAKGVERAAARAGHQHSHTLDTGLKKPADDTPAPIPANDQTKPAATVSTQGIEAEPIAASALTHSA